MLSESSIGVLNNPGLLASLPKLLMGRSNSVRFSPLFVIRRLGWGMLKFLSYCTTSRWQAAGRALRALQTLSLDQHKAWIAEAGVDDLLRYGGWMKAFRTTESFEAYAGELALADENGVVYSVFDESQLRQIEPGLKPIYKKAVLYDETCGVSNPAALTDAYVAMFVESGGTVLQASVSGLSQGESGWHVGLDGADYLSPDDVVIAAGAWSAANLPDGSATTCRLAGRARLSPCIWSRPTGPQLNRAVHDVDGGFAHCADAAGEMRITSGGRDCPPGCPAGLQPDQTLGGAGPRRA